MPNLRNWSAGLAVMAALMSCESFDEFSENIGQQPAEATDSVVGFDVESGFPNRDTSVDRYYQLGKGLTAQELTTLFEHVAFPQSREAITSLLGTPFDAEGDYAYWKIEGGSSELAIYIVGDTAYSYTVGY
ncbi:MAG: hypothetical protein WA949_07345 [Phormidesmis sp.]